MKEIQAIIIMFMLLKFSHSLMFQYAFKFKSWFAYSMCILLKIYFILFICIKIKKVGKPIGYRTSLNDLNIHTKQLHRRITMNTDLY